MCPPPNYTTVTPIRLCGRPISLLGTHGLVRVLSLQTIACLSIYVTCIHTRPHQKNGVPLSHLTPSKLIHPLSRARSSRDHLHGYIARRYVFSFVLFASSRSSFCWNSLSRGTIWWKLGRLPWSTFQQVEMRARSSASHFLGIRCERERHREREKSAAVELFARSCVRACILSAHRSMAIL